MRATKLSTGNKSSYSLKISTSRAAYIGCCKMHRATRNHFNEQLYSYVCKSVHLQMFEYIFVCVCSRTCVCKGVCAREVKCNGVSFKWQQSVE